MPRGSSQLSNHRHPSAFYRHRHHDHRHHRQQPVLASIRPDVGQARRTRDASVFDGTAARPAAATSSHSNKALKSAHLHRHSIVRLAPSQSILLKPSIYSLSIHLIVSSPCARTAALCRERSLHQHPSTSIIIHPTSIIIRHAASSITPPTALRRQRAIIPPSHPSIHSHPSSWLFAAFSVAAFRREPRRHLSTSIIIHPTSIISHHAAYGVPLFASHHLSSLSSSHLSSSSHLARI